MKIFYIRHIDSLLKIGKIIPKEKNMECNMEKNKINCTCTYEPCPHKGRCCECITYHWDMAELPGCLFPPDIEQTYDRSIKKFISTYRD